MRTPFASLVPLVLLAGLAFAGRASGEPSPPRIETFELPSPWIDTSTPGGALEDGRAVPKVHVLLPAGYDDNRRRRYPVLWLLHGATWGADSWLLSWNHIADLAEGLPGIVVMPDGGELGMYTDWWNDGARGNPAWIPYHLELLRETTESRYRIRPGRRWHAIAGVSMGGQGALRYAALLPGYFGSVAGFSAALPDMRTLTAQAGVSIAIVGSGLDITYETIYGPADAPWAEGQSAQGLAPNFQHTRVYVNSGDGTKCPGDAVGSGDAGGAVTETFINIHQGPFAAAAREAGAKVTEVTTCGVHDHAPFHRAFAAARAWGFWKGVSNRPRQWTYRTITSEGEMWGLRYRFDEPPAAVVEFTRSGRTLAGTGEGSAVIDGPPGCSLRVDLPFELDLPRDCRR